MIENFEQKCANIPQNEYVINKVSSSNIVRTTTTVNKKINNKNNRTSNGIVRTYQDGFKDGFYAYHKLPQSRLGRELFCILLKNKVMYPQECAKFLTKVSNTSQRSVRSIHHYQVIRELEKYPNIFEEITNPNHPLVQHMINNYFYKSNRPRRRTRFFKLKDNFIENREMLLWILKEELGNKILEFKHEKQIYRKLPHEIKREKLLKKAERKRKKLMKEALEKQKHTEKWYKIRNNLVKQFKTKNHALNLLDHAKKDNSDFKKELTGLEQSMISTGFDEFMKIWKKNPSDAVTESEEEKKNWKEI